MKKNTNPVQTETYYHIYDRGINGTAIFKEEKNYFHFLNLYSKYISLVADTYAYCLLGNHFHFLIRTKSEQEIFKNIRIAKEGRDRDVGEVHNLADVPTIPVTPTKTATFHISNQFAKLFNSYTQSFNKIHERTGGLFEEPFRRIPVADDGYFTAIIYYIHTNPKKHGICEDFEHYPYSSYSAFVLQKQTQLKRENVLDWFGNKEELIKFHQMANVGEVVNIVDVI